MSVESFLKARSRNLAEEIRFSHWLQTLELEKRQWEKQSFNQQYEDQKLAFSLKKQKQEIKKRRDRKKRIRNGEENGQQLDRRPIQGSKSPNIKAQFKLPDISFLTNSLISLNEANRPYTPAPKDPDTADPEDIDIEIDESKGGKPAAGGEFQPAKAMPKITMSGGFSNISDDILKPKKKKRTYVVPDSGSLPDISITNKVTVAAIPEVSGEGDGDGTGEDVVIGIVTALPDVHKDETKSEGGATSLTIKATGNAKFASVVERLLDQQRRLREVAEDTRTEIGGYAPSERSAREVIDPNPKTVNVKDLVGRLHPKSLRKAKSLEDLEKLKDEDSTEKKMPEKTMKKEDGENDENTEDEADDSEIMENPVIIVNDFWVGDPKAINSVRRGRQPPEVMNARHRNVGEVMKLIRDLPMFQSCSRNCTKPSAIFDSMAAGSTPQVMTPSMAKANVARHARAKQRLKKAARHINLAIKVVDSFNKAPVLPAITVTDADDSASGAVADVTVIAPPAVAVHNAEMAAPSMQKRIQKECDKKNAALRKTTRELRRNLRAATERQTFKPTQKVVMAPDGRGARVQIAYTFDPISKLRNGQQNSGRTNKASTTTAAS